MILWLEEILYQKIQSLYHHEIALLYPVSFGFVPSTVFLGKMHIGLSSLLVGGVLGFAPRHFGSEDLYVYTNLNIYLYIHMYIKGIIIYGCINLSIDIFKYQYKYIFEFKKTQLTT